MMIFAVLVEHDHEGDELACLCAYELEAEARCERYREVIRRRSRAGLYGHWPPLVRVEAMELGGDVDYEAIR